MIGEMTAVGNKLAVQKFLRKKRANKALHRETNAAEIRKQRAEPLQIFKFQRALHSSGGVDMVLVYNKDQSIMSEFPTTKLEAMLFAEYGLPPEKVKCYIWGRIVNKKIELNEAAFPQDW